MGDKKADLVLKNCSLVNVYTREIVPKMQIAIIKDRMAYVGPDASHTVGQNTAVMDLYDKYVAPGFADPHLHIDQFVMPSELAKHSLLCGTTSLFSDPIDIVSVCGFRGFKEFVNASSGLPIRIFQVVPGGLPVDRKFSHGKALSLREQAAAIKLDGVVGLGEVFSWTKVTTRDAETMKKLSNMLQNDCIINGHTAGASDKKLNAYISSGIISCHEPIDFDQVMDRLRLGMWIMMREGSIRRDLKNIMPKIIESKPYLDRLMFCSDGLDPLDITKYGHMDHCVREAMRLGLDAIDAITIASKNCFDYYNMGKDLGGVAPGKLADILVFDDLEKIKPKKVFVGGQLVASNGSIVTKIRRPALSKWITRTVKLTKTFTEADFKIPSKNPQVQANLIEMDTEIITKQSTADLVARDGNVLPSADKDVWKVSAFDRTYGTGKRAIGFLKNFGADVGAFGSTWCFHENDMIIIGSNEKDMAQAANHLKKSQGGLVVVKGGDILSFLPLQVAGIISSNSFEDVLNKFLDLNSVLIDRGCKFQRPHLIPLFLPFLALPSIRILHSGIVDVKKRSIIQALA
ncbi:MAG TPA: adenine deaminase C-terminal domain-containing protein [Candidatus Nitrosotenuis sp.]|nr:adenine deaminase C-terminal domain-containing protein [Candidatus Nitrosotenuis sp.]